ncbi:hypothetical protein [Pseudomonas amygdali]|uniref:hypothetical protein n=1 Tax=Pseudomonas amygdali TaxID=47877 RepID=UPI000CD2CEF1|nr:hypothetical protein [Pseudomonas amygdali]POD06702.1 hypothetical protein BKM22_00785 [Pseudomonas amygdali pv. morsprunorum]POD48939.1 hypothetical protein BKM16_00785 [Pseudomonas amygdali pv. morsprunorum]POD54234.1 hypothetical protein BKM02_00790 [Pseudomonas amygdali pv. morsprunorum]POY77250.1 hypothetical protein BKM09_030460 [Pseudomonas amygdali pv. morsprunorum]
MSDFDEMNQVFKRSLAFRDNRSSLTAFKRFEAIGDELDTTLNFKLNSGLKSEFDKLCKENESNISRELKLYMKAAVISGKLGS